MAQVFSILLVGILISSCDMLAVKDEPGLCFQKKHDGSDDGIYLIDQSTKDIAIQGRLVSGNGKEEVIISGFDGTFKEVSCPAELKTK